MTTVKEKYGYLPTSVWHITKSKKFRDIVKDNSKARINKRGTDCKYLPNLSFSEFNPDLAKRIIEYWSEEGDIVLDPFAGRSTRMIMSNLLNRNYIGFEVSPLAYKDLITKSKNKQQSLFNTSKIQIYLRDGCQLDNIKNELVDLVFTCPPYFNLEKYEHVPNQLSDCKSYEEYLEKIRKCSKRCYEVLKQDKFCVWVVADFRNNGFKALHRDILNIFENEGFKIWDTVINVLNSPFAYCQIGKCEKQKYTSKTHEYVLVFKK